MKTIVLVRTLDEEANIARFCRCYAQVDKILVADGGSVDCTLEIAATFENVEIRHFRRRTFYRDGIFFNPESMHMNFLIDWAVQEEEPDWLIADDADCIPTDALHGVMLDMLAAGGSIIAAYKLYVLGKKEYLPLMSIPGQCIWAWRPGDLPGIRADDGIPETQFGFVGVPPKRTVGRIDLSPPFVLLHYFAPSPAERARKMDRYAARGTPQTPLKHTEYWPPQPLPDWAVPPQLDARTGKRGALKLIKTDVLTCYSCGAWVGRLPKWCAAELGKGWGCKRCGNTSINVRDGRSYGPRSARWDGLAAEFWQLIVDFSDDPSYLKWLWTTVAMEEKR